MCSSSETELICGSDSFLKKWSRYFSLKEEKSYFNLYEIRISID